VADNDLDKYLNDLGIDTDAHEKSPPAPPTRPETEPYRHEDEAEEAEVYETYDSSAQMPVVSGAGPAERCESFLVNLLLNLDPAYAAEVREVDGGLEANIYGGDAGKIIGRGGRTLAALEYLTNAVVNKDEALPHVRVSVDVGGYKERRDERLRGVALKAAARARKTGFAVELEPMSAAERRVVHMTLADDPAVESESSGEGKNRRVVVRLR
jgi:spoIIIJ-associated protein